MTPTHVTLYRCAGGCLSSPGLTVCVARLSRTKTVPVMLARCGLGPGLCDKTCATITVTEDSECQCDCDKEDRERCEASPAHQWREGSCQCQCQDSQVTRGRTGGLGPGNLIIVQARRDCQERGHHWAADNCTCHTPRIELSPHLHTPHPPDTETERLSVTREIVVIVLLATINTCLVVIVVLLLARLRRVRTSVKEDQRREEEEEWCEVERRDDSDLRGPRAISHKTYSDIDIYSASSGFVSESSQETAEPCYQTPQSVRENKYQLKETYQELPRAIPGDVTYDRAMRAIDQTLQMLKDSADKL